MQAMACAAKASLSSIRSRSPAPESRAGECLSGGRYRAESHAARVYAGYGGAHDARDGLPAQLPRHLRRRDGDRSRAVVDAAGGSCRHGAVPLKRRRQAGQALQGDVGARRLVAGHRRDRHELVLEHARAERRLRPSLALHRELLLLPPSDPPGRRDPFGGHAEGNRPVGGEVGIGEPPADGTVGHGRSRAIPRLRRLEHDVGRPCHALHAAREDQRGLVGPDRVGGARHGLKTRAAESIHRLARHLHREAGEQQRHSGHVPVVLARLIGAAEDDVVDPAGR